MTRLPDASLERLCDLFGSGSMEHAQEISRLLVKEIDETKLRSETGFVSDLLRRAVLALQIRQASVLAVFHIIHRLHF
jgi:hypothetical protein